MTTFGASQTTVGGPATSTGFDVNKLFANENFLRMLAGIGTALDPDGPGGRLGKVADALIVNTKSQEALAKQLNPSQQAVINPNATVEPTRDSGLAQKVSQLLTPAGEEGLTSIARKGSGEIQVTYTPKSIAGLPNETQTRNDIEQTVMSDFPLSQSPAGNLVYNSYQNSSPNNQLSVSLQQNRLAPISGIKQSIHRISNEVGVDPLLMEALISHESNFNPTAVNQKSKASGLGQLMPGTAKDLGVTNVFDSEQNIRGSARYMKQQLERFNGNISLALAAYNAGPQRVIDAGNHIPNIKETQNLVADVLKRRAALGNTPNLVQNTSTVVPNQVPQEQIVVPTTSQPELELLPFSSNRSNAQSIESELSQLKEIVDGMKSFTRNSGLTASDMEGLGIDELKLLATTEFQQRSVAADIAKTIGSTVENVKTRIAKTQGDFTKLKLDAVKNISNSSLNPPNKEKLLQLLSTATNPQEVEIVESITARFQPTSAGIDRDAYATQLFGGRYYELNQTQQNIVNARLNELNTNNREVVVSDGGTLIVDKRTGNVIPLQVGPNFIPGSSQLNSPQQSVQNQPSNLINQPGQSQPSNPSNPTNIQPQNNLSPFAKSISSQPTELNIGDKVPGKPMNEMQGKAFGFGSRALQDHELATQLENDKTNRAKVASFTTYLNNKLATLDSKSVAATAGLVTGPGLAFLSVDKLVDALTNEIAPEGSVREIARSPRSALIIRSALKGVSRGALIGTLTGIATVTLAEPIAQLLRTPEEQSYMYAKMSFISAKLRRESGSAISIQEFVNEDKILFPQVGDSEQVILEKQQRRQQVLLGMRQEAGRNFLPPIINPLAPPPVIPTQVNEYIPDTGPEGAIQQYRPSSSVAPPSIPQSTNTAISGPKVNSESQKPDTRLSVLNTIRRSVTTTEIIKGDADIDAILKNLGALSKSEYESLPRTYQHAIKSRRRKLQLAE